MTKSSPARRRRRLSGVSPRTHADREPHRIDWPMPDGAPTPRPGDYLLGCVHALAVARASGPGSPGLHVFHLGDGVDYTRADGTAGRAQWFHMCHGCFAVYRDRPLDCPFNTDALLVGEDEKSEPS